MGKILFTPGPVMMFPETISAAAIQIPYSRTPAFSALLLKAESAILKLVSAPDGSRAVFLTGSGTAAMEAAVLNFIDASSAAAIINGGSFGQRFSEICARHGFPFQEAKVDRDPLTDGTALITLRAPISALFVTAHETSVGHAYDLQATAGFCREHDCLHVVDGISLIATDRLEMTTSAIDVLILSSNKGLALAPGVSILILSPKALARIVAKPRTYYLDLRVMLAEASRGQTPFTPAIGTMLQLEARLSALLKTGIAQSIEHASRLAARFRAGIEHMPLRPHARHMPNAMTALEVNTPDLSARAIVDRLDTEFGLVVAPNGGKLEATVFRVGHMGNLATSDIDSLIKALKQIFQSGLRRPYDDSGKDSRIYVRNLRHAAH